MALSLSIRVGAYCAIRPYGNATFTVTNHRRHCSRVQIRLGQTHQPATRYAGRTRLATQLLRTRDTERRRFKPAKRIHYTEPFAMGTGRGKPCGKTVASPPLVQAVGDRVWLRLMMKR